MRLEGESENASPDRNDDGPTKLFARNRAWAESKLRIDPAFFDRLVGQQTPRYFWIGCSDSRVPATEIVDLDPGEMFVHRNVANLAMESDPSFSATLQFAVEVLEVQHIMVVGHYGCGGIQAAMGDETDDAIGRWLEPLRKLHRDRLGQLGREATDPHRLCEANVGAQVGALATNPVVRKVWSRGTDLVLHGWVYAIGDGLLREACSPMHRPVSGRQFGDGEENGA